MIDGGSSAASAENPVIVEVVDWWWTMPRRPQWAVLVGSTLLGCIVWWSASALAGFAIGVAGLIGGGVPGRYLIVAARLDETLELRFLGGRELTVDPTTVRLCRDSFW